MPVEFNHTIVWSKDSRASAAFLAGILGLPPPRKWGPFQVVATSNGVSLDFMDRQGEVLSRHFAFLVSETEFDEIFERIRGRVSPTGPTRRGQSRVRSTATMADAASISRTRTVTCWKSSRGRTVAVAGSLNTRKRGRAELLAKENEKTSSQEDMSGITKAALSVFGTAWFLLVARRPLRHGLSGSQCR